jgi:hypothetical protein
VISSATNSLLGTYLLAIRGERRDYGLVLGLLALLLMLAVFFTLHYGASIMYDRRLIYTMLLMSIVAGAGLMCVKSLKLPAGLFTQNIGNILCLILVGLTLALSIPTRQNTPYYHMIDQEDYQAFV